MMAAAAPTPVDGLLAEGIIPNLKKLVAAWNAGRMPVLFYAAGDGGDAQWARELGWSGERVELARMTRQQVYRYANALVWLLPDRPAAARWLRRRGGEPRLLVLCNRGTLCLNYDAETGFAPEPGT